MDSAVSRPPGSLADRGQSNVIGLVLVLAMVVVGIGLVVALGAAALDSTQQQSELERAEHSMTLFDSRASMVALGDSPSQQVSFGNDGGEFSGATDSGWLRVTHANYSGTADEVLFNETLGAVVYENDGTEIAYQGGGVWRKGRQGDARMVSPPEFHYRGATLTLPIIRVDEADSGGSGSSATISRIEETRRVFPNVTAPTAGGEIGAPYNGSSDRQYTNPVANGTVNITVKSEYYAGWAEYFRAHTDGDVKVFPGDERVRVTLKSLAGSIGDFQMPQAGNSISIRGMGSDHPLNSYTMTLKEGKNWNNMHWSMYTDEGNEKFELHFKAVQGGKCKSGTYDGDIITNIYYYNSSAGDTIEEEWNTTVDVSANPDFDIDCNTKELTVDLMNNTMISYGDAKDLSGNDKKYYFQSEMDSHDVDSKTTSFDNHSPADGGQISPGGTRKLSYVVNHYFQLLGPSFDLTVNAGPGNNSDPIDESASSGTLDFDPSTDTQYITFLHITENRVDVDFD